MQQLVDIPTGKYNVGLINSHFRPRGKIYRLKEYIFLLPREVCVRLTARYWVSEVYQVSQPRSRDTNDELASLCSTVHAT